MIRTCPACHRGIEEDSCVSNAGHKPEAGDFSICFYCFAVLVYTDSLSFELFRGKIPDEVAAYRDGLRAFKRAFAPN